MCLAIPACIESIDENLLAQVDILGVKRQAALDLTPQAQVGDFVLVHAGFAIEVVDTQVAQETLEIVKLLDPAALAEATGPLDDSIAGGMFGGGLGGFGQPGAPGNARPMTLGQLLASDPDEAAVAAGVPAGKPDKTGEPAGPAGEAVKAADPASPAGE